MVFLHLGIVIGHLIIRIRIDLDDRSIGLGDCLNNPFDDGGLVPILGTLELLLAEDVLNNRLHIH